MNQVMVQDNSSNLTPDEFRCSPGEPTQKTMVDPVLAGSAGTWSTVGDRRQDRALDDNGPHAPVTTRCLYEIAGSETPYAEGGMGTILLAQDETLGRTVVLKVLHQKHRHNPELCLRFRREAAITAQLQHPGVPPVFGAGSLADARPFFSMRLVQGRTLVQLLSASRDHSRDRPRLLTIFQQVCQTIAFAHAQGVIHRDLKPENIVVGDHGTVYVMDWGLARLNHESPVKAGILAVSASDPLPVAETLVVAGDGGGPAGLAEDSTPATSGELLGTPQYMSPEQARGDGDQDDRTDVFSLGAILFEILVGEPLRPVTFVPRGSLERFAEDHLETASLRLESCGADPPLVDLVERCLQRQRDRRPRDASEVASFITAHLLHMLQRPEREMARFFELSLDLFCLAGLDGYFKQVNSNFDRVLGYSTEELLSKPFLEFVHPDDRVRTQDQVARLSRGLPVVRFENRYRDRLGEYKWFEWAAKAVPEDGIVFATAREITDRKNLEQGIQAKIVDLGERQREPARYQDLIESFPTGVLLIDSAGMIRLGNQKTEQLFGYPRGELIGRHVRTLLSQDVPDGGSNPSDTPFAHSCDDTETKVQELIARRKDGTEFPVEIRTNRFESPEGVFLLGAVMERSGARPA
jgi:serine/threonine-protein kinase